MVETTTKAPENGASKQKGSRVRSPARPGINLETAIARAKTFYEHEKRNPAPVDVAMRHWGFKEKSGPGLVTVAALKNFGLLSDSGTGKERTIKLTDNALRILLDQRQEAPERDAAIKESALRPKIHATLWRKWGTALPSDGNLRHTLIFEWKFNENSVDDFIREYKETIRYAKLTDSDSISADDGDIEEESEMNGAQEVSPSLRIGNQPPTAKKAEQPGAKEISMPVGFSEEGQVVFAHLRFDAPLKKEFLVSLGKLLQALEKGLEVKGQKDGEDNPVHQVQKVV